MIQKFIADENIPFQVAKTLNEAGYKVATISEAAHPGMKNADLAKLSVQLKMTILTRDADFTHLRQSLMRKIKVIYIKLSGDPNSIAQHQSPLNPAKALQPQNINNRCLRGTHKTQREGIGENDREVPFQSFMRIAKQRLKTYLQHIWIIH